MNFRPLNLIDFDKYTITEDGKIFSKYWNRQLCGTIDQDGYTLVHLKLTNSTYMKFFLHRVIWFYFNGEIPSDKIIDHIIPISNGGTNALSNLRLVTPKENSNNSHSIENLCNAQKGHKPTIFKNNAKLSRPVIQVKPNGDVIEYPSANEASRQTGCYNVSQICNGGAFSNGKWLNIYGWKNNKFYWKSNYYS